MSDLSGAATAAAAYISSRISAGASASRSSSEQTISSNSGRESEISDDDIRVAVKKSNQPRCFTKQMKDQCWKNATLMIGRSPERWRLDAVGNPILKGLTSCMGPLCHEYDHIIPFSKGGRTEVPNCQLLQTVVNRFKSNITDHTFVDLKAVSPTQRFTNSEFDAVEKAIYGDVIKVNAQQQVEEASKQSLQIIYAVKHPQHHHNHHHSQSQPPNSQQQQQQQNNVTD